jgi:hypothetical protein
MTHAASYLLRKMNLESHNSSALSLQVPIDLVVTV